MPISTPTFTRYVELIHLSDLHFGAGHRFSPEPTPDGAAAAEPDFPTLGDLITRDLLDPANDPPRPTLLVSGHEGTDPWHVPPMSKIVCISGDFTVTANKNEFAQAATFVKRLTRPVPDGL